MPQIVMADAAKRVMTKHAPSLLDCSQALVITSHGKTDTYVARFIDVTLLDKLNTLFLGEMEWGIEVHSFGIDPFPASACLELDFLPIRSSRRQRGPETAPSFIFRVFVKQDSGRNLQVI